MGSLGWLEIKRRPSELWGGWRKKGGLPIKGKKQTEEGSLGEEREKLKKLEDEGGFRLGSRGAFPGSRGQKGDHPNIEWMDKKKGDHPGAGGVDLRSAASGNRTQLSSVTGWHTNRYTNTATQFRAELVMPPESDSPTQV